MAFGNISTLHFPVAASAGASLWGTDVRKLLASPNATVDTTTISSHGTGGTATSRNVDPYTTSTGVSGTKGLFGWAIDPTDMGSVNGALRFYRAGIHTSNMVLSHNGAASDNVTIYVYAYRVSSAATGRTRTLLGSTADTATLPALSGETFSFIGLTLPEIVFQPDETIQWMYEVSATGTVVVGHTVTFRTGTASSLATGLSTPELGVLARTSGAATGTGAATASGGIVLGTAGTASGAGNASGAGASNAATTGIATGSGAAAGSGAAVAGAIGAAEGAADATGSGSAVIGTVGTAEVGAGSASPIIRPIFIF